MIQFSDLMKSKLVAAGLYNAAHARLPSDQEHFGNAEALFAVNGLLLKFVIDRGQTFLDIASAAKPTVFHQFDDVEIAMGWKTIDQVMAKLEPEDISRILLRVKENLVPLIGAFSNEQECFMRARTQRIAQTRGTNLPNASAAIDDE